MPFILTIQERNSSWAGRGPVRSEHATPEEAQSVLLEYVQRNWETEIGTEAPKDPKEMIEAYFAGRFGNLHDLTVRVIGRNRTI